MIMCLCAAIVRRFYPSCVVSRPPPLIMFGSSPKVHFFLCSLCNFCRCSVVRFCAVSSCFCIGCCCGLLVMGCPMFFCDVVSCVVRCVSGLNTDVVYPNGLSNALPEEIQLQMLRTIPGLESVDMIRPGTLLLLFFVLSCFFLYYVF